MGSQTSPRSFLLLQEPGQVPGPPSCPTGTGLIQELKCREGKLCKGASGLNKRFQRAEELLGRALGL